MPIICLMVRENHKMVREKSGNFVRAHGWTPWTWFGSRLLIVFSGASTITKYCYTMTNINAYVTIRNELQGVAANVIRRMGSQLDPRAQCWSFWLLGTDLPISHNGHTRPLHIFIVICSEGPRNEGRSGKAECRLCIELPGSDTVLTNIPG